jgi:enamine deaminase RidA (YjgF/YER057c/UK114 family)
MRRRKRHAQLRWLVLRSCAKFSAICVLCPATNSVQTEADDVASLNAVNLFANDADKKLISVGLELPPPVTPFGEYVEAVQTGNLLFLTGALPVLGHDVQYRGRIGGDFDTAQGRAATRLAGLNALVTAKEHLGSLNRVKRVVRLGVMLATYGDRVEHAEVADAASELFRDVFGSAKNPVRLVYGVASLPLNVPVELEVIFEVA